MCFTFSPSFFSLSLSACLITSPAYSRLSFFAICHHTFAAALHLSTSRSPPPPPLSSSTYIFRCSAFFSYFFLSFFFNSSAFLFFSRFFLILIINFFSFLLLFLHLTLVSYLIPFSSSSITFASMSFLLPISFPTSLPLFLPLSFPLLFSFLLHLYIRSSASYHHYNNYFIFFVFLFIFYFFSFSLPPSSLHSSPSFRFARHLLLRIFTCFEHHLPPLHLPPTLFTSTASYTLAPSHFLPPSYHISFLPPTFFPFSASFFFCPLFLRTDFTTSLFFFFTLPLSFPSLCPYYSGFKPDPLSRRENTYPHCPEGIAKTA